MIHEQATRESSLRTASACRFDKSNNYPGVSFDAEKVADKIWKAKRGDIIQYALCGLTNSEINALENIFEKKYHKPLKDFVKKALSGLWISELGELTTMTQGRDGLALINSAHRHKDFIPQRAVSVRAYQPLLDTVISAHNRATRIFYRVSDAEETGVFFELKSDSELSGEVAKVQEEIKKALARKSDPQLASQLRELSANFAVLEAVADRPIEMCLSYSRTGRRTVPNSNYMSVKMALAEIGAFAFGLDRAIPIH